MPPTALDERFSQFRTLRPEAHELSLEPNELVRRLERLRTANGRAVIYSVDIVPERFVSAVTNKRFNRSLYDVLKSIDESVSARTRCCCPSLPINDCRRCLTSRSAAPSSRSTKWTSTKMVIPLCFPRNGTCRASSSCGSIAGHDPTLVGQQLSGDPGQMTKLCAHVTVHLREKRTKSCQPTAQP